MNTTTILNNGKEIPLLGFGTWKVQDTVGLHAIQTALQVGYRHIDTAEMYQNHAIVNQAIATSGIARSDLYITTKLGLNKRSTAEVIQAAAQYLEELGLSYIDLLLIHWPDSTLDINATLLGLQEVQAQGLVRSIGVSNFTIPHLEEVLDLGVQIQMNQVEIHPTLPQHALVEYCQRHSIHITAYSPLGRTHDLQLPIITEIATNKNVHPSSIVLRWLIQKEIIAIPKASHIEHMQANFSALSITLTEEEMHRIDAITENNNRLVNPDFAEF
jgi:2,5-diketo-D-gluconate reductase B